jgi:predicted secreted Zn-dependent protease
VDAQPSDRLTWRRSSHCSDSSCVEVAWIGEDVLVRDSKDPSGPVLGFSRRQWAAFLRGVRSGEFQER